MIYEICSRIIEEYKKDQLRKLESYLNVESFFFEKDITSRILYAKEAQDKLKRLEYINIDDCFGNVMEEIKEQFKREFEEYSERLRDLEFFKVQQESERLNQFTKRVEAAEKDVEKERLKVQQSIHSVVEKHAAINRGEMENIIKLYKLSINEDAVDVEKLSLSEIEEMLEAAKYAETLVIGNSKIGEKVLRLIYFPITYSSPSNETNDIVRYFHFLSLLLIFFLLKPYSMAVVGLIYVITMFSNLYKVNERKELIQEAYSISRPIDFVKFVNNNMDVKRAEVDLEKARFELLQIDYSDIGRDYDAKVAEFELKDPKIAFDKIQMEYNIECTTIAEKFEEATNYMKREYDRILDLHRSHIENIDKHFSDIKQGLQPLGTHIQQTKVLDLEFAAGAAYYNGEVVAEATIDIPLTSINFFYSEENYQSIVDFVKLLLCNAFCNVQERYMVVDIFDPNGLAKDFSEFLDPAIENYISLVTSDFKKLSDRLLEEGRVAIAKMKTLDVQTYNIEASKVGKLTKDYRIVIIVSDGHSLMQNKQFCDFMQYSAKFGTFIWNIEPLRTKFSTNNEEEKIAYTKFFNSVAYCTEAGKILCGGELLGGFTNPVQTYNYNVQLGIDTVEALKYSLEHSKIEAIDYETRFRQVNIPDDKIWTYSTLKGVQLFPGLVDGDPDKPVPLVLGNKPVHGIMVGETGAGKSATINQILANILYMYPPEEVELVMVDFKNVEFGMYTGDYLIPHARIIAGTKDGEYALSIFEYLLEQMKDRQQKFGEHQLQNLEDYNNLMKKLGMSEKCLPRIVILIDEFQVMFRDIEAKIIEKIKAAIVALAALARFCGAHMWFTSQNMKGTLPEDVLDQFGLRMALGCSKTVSTDIIGNPAASTLKGIGWIYTNDSGGKTESANKLYRIPFISNREIKNYIPKLIDKCNREGRIHRRARFYNEDQLHYQEELIKVYFDNPMLFENNGTILLGERTMFNTNQLPFGVVMRRDDNENIMCSCFERISMINLALTFIENFKQRKVDYMVHCADKENIKLMDLPNNVPEDYRIMVEEPMESEEIIEILQSMVEQRQEWDPDQLTEFYFVAINWDKYRGIGVDERTSVAGKFKRILQQCGLVNIHVIILVKDAKPFRQYMSCIDHRIASKCAEADSQLLFDTDKAKNLKETFAMYLHGTDMSKFKIYQFPLNGKIESREVKIA